MKRLVTALTAAVCLLVWAGAAQAKELRSAQACGAAGCTSVKGAVLLHRLIRLVESQGEPVAAAVPAPTRFYRIDFEVRGDGGPGPSFSQYYVPGIAEAAVETGPRQWTWVRVADPRLLRLYDRVVAGTTPFAPPRITGATVGGKRVASAASYALLLTIDGDASPNLSQPDWIPIELSSAQASPWTTGTTPLEYSPGTHLLWRGDRFIPLPDATASAIEHGRPLRLQKSEGFPWLVLPAALAAAALAAVGLVALRRRRPSPQPAL